MRPSALFLDCYGTLVAGDRPVIDDVVRAVARRTGLPKAPLDRAWWERFSRLCAERSGASFASQRELELTAMAQVLADGGTPLPAGEIERLLQPLFRYWRSAAPFPDAIALLRDWTACPVIVVSNIDRADLDRVLPSLPRVARVITSEEARAYKPDPAFFAHALAVTGLAPEQVVHVGDSWESDVAGAAAAGIPVIWLDRTGGGPTSSRPAGQPRIATLTELPARIAGLGQPPGSAAPGTVGAAGSRRAPG